MNITKRRFQMRWQVTILLVNSPDISSSLNEFLECLVKIHMNPGGYFSCKAKKTFTRTQSALQVRYSNLIL